jgi:hypothetical protein
MSLTNQIDVCNGDADGLCAVVQWRLHQPATSRLVTGLKRDIELLQRVQAQPGDHVLVCDVSMRRNRPALLRLLHSAVHVRYFDHHEPGETLVHPLLDAHINTTSGVCTSLLVNRYLAGAYQAWALVGAYGDNLAPAAHALAAGMGLGLEDRHRLQRLGESINYNAYGDSVQDVHVAPERLYEILVRYRNPLDLVWNEPIALELDALRKDDLARATALKPQWNNATGRVYLLPDAPWCRRVVGVLANALAASQPQCAHAILQPGGVGTLRVSVRAPLSASGGAAALCRQFGGDGRAGAAGIDHLPAGDVDRFLSAFSVARWGEPGAVKA